MSRQKGLGKNAGENLYLLRDDQRKWKGKVGLRKNVPEGVKNTERIGVIENGRKCSKRRKWPTMLNAVKVK